MFLFHVKHGFETAFLRQQMFHVKHASTITLLNRIHYRKTLFHVEQLKTKDITLSQCQITTIQRRINKLSKNQPKNVKTGEEIHSALPSCHSKLTQQIYFNFIKN